MFLGLLTADEDEEIIGQKTIFQPQKVKG